MANQSDDNEWDDDNDEEIEDERRPRARRGRRRGLQVGQKLGHWVVLGVNVYIAFRHFSGDPVNGTDLLKDVPGISEKSLPVAAVSRPDILVQEIPSAPINFFPTMTPIFDIRDLAKGEGTEAICGQDVTLRYRAVINESIDPDDSPDNMTTRNIRLGKASNPRALEMAAVGMREGGRRLARSAPIYAKELESGELKEKDMALFDIHLNKATPLPPKSEMPLRVYVDQHGNGIGLRCGDEAELIISLWDLSGARIYPPSETEENTMHATIGLAQLPYGMEQGVIGMQPGGERTLIIPPAHLVYFNPPPGAKPADQLLSGINLDHKQALLAKIVYIGPYEANKKPEFINNPVSEPTSPLTSPQNPPKGAPPAPLPKEQKEPVSPADTPAPEVPEIKDFDRP